jgi:hypothetical protein
MGWSIMTRTIVLRVLWWLLCYCCFFFFFFHHHEMADALTVRQEQRTRRECFGATVTTCTAAVAAGGGGVVAAPQPAFADAAADLARIEEQERLERLRKEKEQGPPTIAKLRQAFPGALPNDVLLERVGKRLAASHGFSRETTLVASSLCSDEVNRPLEAAIRRYYGDSYFAMGGLAGFPFSGVTGFGAMASHIPDGGNCLLVYGPHVGVDSEGNVGKVDRRGKKASGTCCGSAVAASKMLSPVVAGQEDVSAGVVPPAKPADAQQSYVTSFLLPYASEIASAKEPMVSLPYVTFKPIDNMMNKIVSQSSSKVGEKGQIAMLGGLQVRDLYVRVWCSALSLSAFVWSNLTNITLSVMKH